MYRLLLSLTLLLAGFTVYGAENEPALTIQAENENALAGGKEHQPMSRNIYAEFFGPSFGVGIGYDSRFRPGSVLGYSVGLAFTSGSFNYDAGMRDLDFKGVCVPLQVNAVLGGGKSKFEVGLGVTPSILSRDEWKFSYFWEWDEDGEMISAPESSYRHVTRPNILGTINMAYRYQRETGFFLRVGLTAFIGGWRCSPVDGVLLLPCLSLGYTIRY